MEIEPIWEKVYEELQEFKEACQREDFSEQEKEFGDILFAMINLGRYYKINPEIALMRTNHKFRFSICGTKSKGNKKSMGDFYFRRARPFLGRSKAI